MNWQMVNFDWNHIRAFVAAYQHGSLSAAARALNSTQPTISRQISAIEDALNVVLFERGQKRLTLTRAGSELIAPAMQMLESAKQINLQSQALNQSLQGEVTLAVSDFISCYHMPKLLRAFKQMNSNIQLTLITSNQPQDILGREADIAIRHFRAEQNELIVKALPSHKAYLYASDEYIASLGAPLNKQKLMQAKFIGMESMARTLAVYQQFGLALQTEQVSMVVDGTMPAIQMAQSGLGIVPISHFTAANLNGLQRIECIESYLEFPTWLACHQELHKNPRMRLVFDFIANFWADGIL